jgi:hypothetical protein
MMINTSITELTDLPILRPVECYYDVPDEKVKEDVVDGYRFNPDGLIINIMLIFEPAR